MVVDEKIELDKRSDAVGASMKSLLLLQLLLRNDAECYHRFLQLPLLMQANTK